MKRYGLTYYFPLVNRKPMEPLTGSDPTSVLSPTGQTGTVRIEVVFPEGEDPTFMEYAINSVVRQMVQRIKEGKPDE